MPSLLRNLKQPAGRGTQLSNCYELMIDIDLVLYLYISYAALYVDKSFTFDCILSVKRLIKKAHL